ncbi:MAG: hypothetical protein HRU69_04290 [Flammeovirgaceae bacterium]|nr:MAG: hypothetical protein HRU69_04290 [Flammeovirgaceae bacterium]
MFIPFDQLPETARLWIYQAERQLSAQEIATISSRLHTFIEGWSTHGNPVQGSFKVLHNQFIVLAADELVQAPSGCSIDESTRLIRQLDEFFSLGLFNRMVLTFLQNETPHTVPVKELQSLLAENKWNADTLVFDITVNTMAGFRDRFIAPAGKTWLKKYLNRVPA